MHVSSSQIDRSLRKRGGAIAIATSGTAHGERADRPLLEALARAGCSPVSAVWDNPKIDWSAFAACVVRSTWNWHLSPGTFVDWIQRVSESTLLFNAPTTLRWGLDKRYLLALEAKGVAVVPTVLVGTNELRSIPSVAAERGWDRYVVKPTIGASAYQARLIDASGDDSSAMDRGVSGAPAPALVQPFVASVQTAGEVSIMVIDGRPTHAVQKVPAPGDFRVQAEFGGKERLVEIRPEHRRATELCLAAMLELPTYARLDMMTAPSGDVWISECEVVEPELFLDLCPAASELLADAIVRRLGPERLAP